MADRPIPKALTDCALEMGKGGSHGSYPFNAFEACPICGTLMWVCSGSELRDGSAVSVTWSYDNERCRPCNAVRMRAPEVFDWVLRVVSLSEAEGAPHGE